MRAPPPKSNVALVATAGASRTQIAKYLRDGGFDVFECDELEIPSRFVGVVTVEDDQFELARARVQSWIRLRKSPRVVVISSRPARWRLLSLVHVNHLYILPAPAFGWEIVDALRATSTQLPGV